VLDAITCFAIAAITCFGGGGIAAIAALATASEPITLVASPVRPISIIASTIARWSVKLNMPYDVPPGIGSSRSAARVLMPIAPESTRNNPFRSGPNSRMIGGV
jgi:hypothetical protein